MPGMSMTTPAASVAPSRSTTSATPDAAVGGSALTAAAAWASRQSKASAAPTVPVAGAIDAIATGESAQFTNEQTVPVDDFAAARGNAGGNTRHSESERDRSAEREPTLTATSNRATMLTAADREFLSSLSDTRAPMRGVHSLSGTSAPSTMSGTMAAERAAELIAARDAAPAPTVGELRLAFDPQRDGLDEVRLALSGRDLDATLRTSDAGIASGLRSEIASLTKSLERQGFDSARIAIALDQVQQQRASSIETVAQSEATAADRALRGDSDAAREGREQQTARREQQHDHHRDQQRARYTGMRMPRSF
jgi:hypothetical protein